MTGQDRLLTREEAEQIARDASGPELLNHEWITEEQEDRLVLGTSEKDGVFTFRLYVSGQRALDANVLFSATVDRRTGQAQVEVFLPLKHDARWPEQMA